MHNTQETESIEDIIKWQEELYELEKCAVSGRGMTQEQMEKNVREYLDPSYKQHLLDKAKAHKQKLLEELEWTEENIEYITNQIQESANNKVE